MKDITLFCILIIGSILIGYNFLLHGFSRELRQQRPDDDPVIRSDRIDKLVQIACFVLGVLFLVGGLFLVILLIVI